MKQTAFAFLALALSFSLWPATRTLAALGGIHQVGATQLSRWRIPDRLAMSDEDDNDRGYHHKHRKRKQQESESEEDYEHQQFCGRYFRSRQCRISAIIYSQKQLREFAARAMEAHPEEGPAAPGVREEVRADGTAPAWTTETFIVEYG